jgi:hypothetical protein
VAEEIFIINTNAMVALARRSIRSDVIFLFDNLTGQRRLVTVNKVFNELRRKFENVYLLFGKYRKSMVVDHRENPQMLDCNDYIFRKHPKLFDRFSSKDPADPWLIAVAKVKGYVVVTDEGGKYPREGKIPYVCSDLGVNCIGTKEFLHRNKHLTKHNFLKNLELPLDKS